MPIEKDYPMMEQAMKRETPVLALPIEQVAEMCHEANRVYCMLIGDAEQPPWEGAPNWQKKSAIEGVQKVLDDYPCLSGRGKDREQHETWMYTKLMTGWKYGPVKDADKNDCALLLMTGGAASWKLYRLDSGSSIAGSKFVSTENGFTDFPKDELKTGDAFRLIGARSTSHVWATVPDQFFGDGTSDPSSYQLGAGAVSGYGYLAILTRVKDRADTFRIDILIYKNYDASRPPEGNAPAVWCYTTILSSDMLK